jgi:hypothetical protein
VIHKRACEADAALPLLDNFAEMASELLAISTSGKMYADEEESVWHRRRVGLSLVLQMVDEFSNAPSQHQTGFGLSMERHLWAHRLFQTKTLIPLMHATVRLLAHTSGALASRNILEIKTEVLGLCLRTLAAQLGWGWQDRHKSEAQPDMVGDGGEDADEDDVLETLRLLTVATKRSGIVRGRGMGLDVVGAEQEGAEGEDGEERSDNEDEGDDEEDEDESGAESETEDGDAEDSPVTAIKLPSEWAGWLLGSGAASLFSLLSVVYRTLVSLSCAPHLVEGAAGCLGLVR